MFTNLKIRTKLIAAFLNTACIDGGDLHHIPYQDQDDKRKNE